MTKSKINSVKSGKYTFKPTKYDENGNLYCALYRRLNSHHKQVCLLVGIYKFDEEKFEIISVAEGWMNNRHEKLLNFFLNEFDWNM